MRYKGWQLKKRQIKIKKRKNNKILEKKLNPKGDRTRSP